MSDAALVWSSTKVKLCDLKPWARNPRRMSKKQAGRLLKSWDELGQFQTLAIGPDGEVYDGHQRLNALLTVYGQEYEVAARQSDRELTDDERHRIVLEANSLAGAWNWDELSAWEPDKLQAWGMDD